jgi:hypothetical protein
MRAFAQEVLQRMALANGEATETVAPAVAQSRH